MLFHTAVTSQPLEKHIQMGIQHLDWEGCSYTGRYTDQVLAAGFCSILQHTLTHKAQVHGGTPVHFSTLQQHGDCSTYPLSYLWAESTW